LLTTTLTTTLQTTGTIGSEGTGNSVPLTTTIGITE
jgi:hypothetical protein